MLGLSKQECLAIALTPPPYPPPSAPNLVGEGQNSGTGGPFQTGTGGPFPPNYAPKKAKGKSALLGCGGLIALVVLVVIIANAGSKTTPSQPATADKPTAGASADTKPVQAAAAPKTAQALLELQGSGTKSTQKFTASGDWDVNWTYDCSNFGQQGNFQVMVYNGDGSLSFGNQGVNQLGTKGQDIDHFHKGGTYYLEVNSECSWGLKVTG